MRILVVALVTVVVASSVACQGRTEGDDAEKAEGEGDEGEGDEGEGEGGTLTMGFACDASITSDTCADGLTCLDESACDTASRFCTAACEDDADCQAIDPDAVCVTGGCDDALVCLLPATANLGLGDVCDDEHTCAEGLECIPGLDVAGDCSADICSITCTETADCTAIDPDADCFAQCGGGQVCAPTG